ncbi:hypothetical protein TWF696_004196 [Orbilia brochopaga]|uniref:HNH endonuclease n=1 Tax=Orbilia brochopaga TaxID=3140254 RepID=A0AAV9V5I0_9PEZI
MTYEKVVYVHDTAASSAAPPADPKTTLARDRKKEPELYTSYSVCATCRDAGSEYAVTHILPKEDHERFTSYKNAGLLPQDLDTVDDIHNLLYLCLTCRAKYTHRDPRLIILPKNLEFFIHWEIDDYRARENHAAITGHWNARKSPKATEYKDGYRFYVLTDGTAPLALRTRLHQNDVNVRTGAAPTALILHAGKGMGAPLPGPPGYGMPDTVRTQLARLFNLWQRGCPPVEGDQTAEAEAPRTEEDFGRLGWSPGGSGDSDPENFMWGPLMTARGVMKALAEGAVVREVFGHDDRDHDA